MGKEIKDLMSEIPFNEGKSVLFILTGKFNLKNGSWKNFTLGVIRDLTQESMAQARTKASTFIEYKLSKALKEGWFEEGGKRYEIDCSKSERCIFTKPSRKLITKYIKL